MVYTVIKTLSAFPQDGGSFLGVFEDVETARGVAKESMQFYFDEVREFAEGPQGSFGYLVPGGARVEVFASEPNQRVERIL